MISSQELVVDEEKIKKAVQSEIPLTITTFTLPHEIELYIAQVVEVFLKLADQEKLKPYIVYCVQELMVNAKKANTKRVYFAERGLDLEKPDDYELGMARFKEDTLGNIAHYLRRQKELGLYIKLILQSKKNTIYIEVRNNAAITKRELIRIHDKIARSRQYENLEEAMFQVLDDSEGAGLGLVIMILMLNKMGLNEDCFDILGTGKETIARLAVPLQKARAENLSILSQTIVHNVNSLPPFPENIIQAQRMMDDPKVEMAHIARQISKDPALTADLLKAVNSVQYMVSKRVDNIAEAVKIMGIQGIKNMLFSYGTQKMLRSNTLEQKRLWEHSYRTAFYAYNLIKNFRRDRNLLDDAYVSGILHDIGKIVFSNAHPELLNKIRDFCVEKNMPQTTLEDLTAGMNHAEIGALVAEKWNFPERLVCAIRFHHNPEASPGEYKDLVSAVYLADMLGEYEKNAAAYEQINPAALEDFGIRSKKQTDSLLEQLSQGFNRENQAHGRAE
ncbi:MAG: HDOD domain-containing protein [Treponema sp.]|jgi:putative nucleotidyltransferase with HDIG domain|nr:HDOD domain-containing protein [Treponema sp.]